MQLGWRLLPGDQERASHKPVEGSFWRRRGEDLTRLRGAGPRWGGRSILSRTNALLNMEQVGGRQPRSWWTSAVRSSTRLRQVHHHRMPDPVGEEATHASTSKRPRDTPESSQSPPLKRSKTSPAPTTSPKETTTSYDACPMPSVEDYFFEDLIPKAPELSQPCPTLCHNAYVVRRWLGPAGCAIYWTMVMEDINGTTDVPNQPHPLTGLIAHSLTKLRGPKWKASSPKFHVLREILRSHLGDGRRITVFSEFPQLEGLPEINPGQCVMTQLHESPCGC